MTSSNKLHVNEKQKHRISRRLTVDTQEPYISIRPVIKKADKEAATTLCESYADNEFLDWMTGSIKDEEKRMNAYRDIFKALIRAAVSKSRECAVQLSGCHGVMLWTSSESDILSVGNVFGKRKLWNWLGSLGTWRATLVHHRQLAKIKKQVMEGRPHISINFIGVLPAQRGKHVGTNLLKYAIKKADEVQLPIFAEVWDQKTVHWFEKFGFRVQASKTLGEKIGVALYYVVREPSSDAMSPSPLPQNTTILNLQPPREDTIPNSDN
ncbi:hypothetical protein CU098_001665 [Rhizopus stolonifer]|uniref:N-acetyltransferase domain-containing protein n=1 Tax=Rhizopus stolonifer TaxID=4846 RepID=A0A367IUE7_RHIST|nr:hypothetical protein CU098_001665 [Rhizopus stolonifer]